MSEEIVSNSPAWFKLTPAQKAAVSDAGFKDTFAKNKVYNNATPEVKGKIQQAYQKIVDSAAYDSEYNQGNTDAIASQEVTDNSNVLENWGRQIRQSHENLAGRVPLFTEIMTNGATAKFNQNAAKYFEKEKSQIQTKQTKQLASDLKLGLGKWNEGGFFNKVYGGLGVVGAIANNPVGSMDIAAQSMSSMTSMGLGAFGGAKTGGLVGSVFGPKGAIAGALWGGRAGALGAETVDAASAKFMELLKTKLDAQKLHPTEANISRLMLDTEWVSEAKNKAITYGSTLSVADQALAGMATKFAELPAKATKSAIRASLTEANHVALATAAQASGKTVEAVTDSFINAKTAATLAAKSFKEKLDTAVTHYTAEVASEPISEAIGTASAGEENTLENLTYETIGGIGTGPFGVAINKATWGAKTAGDSIVNTVKEAVTSTPEIKAAKAIQKDAIVAATKLSETEAEADYKDKIAAIDPDSDKHKNLSDPAHPSYNPIKAIDALTKVNDPNSHAQANNIAYAYGTALEKQKQEFEALKAEATKDGAKPDVHQVNALKSLFKEIGIKTAIHDKLWDKVDAIQAQVTSKTSVTHASIDVENDSPQDLVTKLGSAGTSNKKDKPTISQVVAALKRPDVNMDSGIKDELVALKEAKQARETIENRAITASKTMKEVSTDIYNGIRGSFFKGADEYQQGIQYFFSPKSATETTPRDAAKAQIELDGLRSFSAAHSLKADMVTKAYAAAIKNKQPSAAVQQYLTDNKITIHPVLSKNYVPTIQSEAAALQKEVKLAEMTFNRLSGQTNTTTSIPVQKAPTEAVVAPTSPSVPVTPTVTAPVDSSVPKTGFTLTKSTGFTKKDQIKASVANAFIGIGVTRKGGKISSTSQYANDAKAQNIPTNGDIKPTKDTIAFVSVSREGTHNKETIAHAVKVIEAGGMVVMDAQGTKDGQSHSKWNKKGEGAVQDALTKLYGKPSKAKNGTTVFRKSTVVATQTTTKPVVSSKPSLAIPQTLEQAQESLDAGKEVTFPAAGHANQAQGKFKIQRQLLNAGYVRIVDTTTKVATFKRSADQEAQQAKKPVVDKPAVPKALTGEADFKRITADYRQGKVTPEGREELLSIWKQAVVNKDNPDHIANILRFGKTYKTALDKIVPVVKTVIPADTAKPTVKPTTVIGSTSKLKTVTLNHKQKDGSIVETQGHEFTVDGLDHKFVVQKVDGKKSQWIVREQTTGTNVTQITKSRKAAVEQAVEIFKKYGKDAIDKAVASHPVKLVTNEQVDNAVIDEITETSEVETVLDEIPVDNMSDYDIDNLTITYTNALGDEVTQTFEQAMEELEIREKEAQAVLDCINSTGR